jgi:phosphate transport system ATP-binding protein
MSQSQTMTEAIKIRVENLFFSYRNRLILKDVNVNFAENAITALTIVCGKTCRMRI